MSFKREFLFIFLNSESYLYLDLVSAESVPRCRFSIAFSQAAGKAPRLSLSLYKSLHRALVGFIWLWKWPSFQNFIPSTSSSSEQITLRETFGEGRSERQRHDWEFWVRKRARVDHFTVIWSGTWSLNGSKAAGDLGYFPLCQTDRSQISGNTWGKWNNILWLNRADQ